MSPTFLDCQGNKVLTLETTTAPPEDVQSISSEDTDSIEASRIIERADEEIVYGRPRDRVTNSVTDEWYAKPRDEFRTHIYIYMYVHVINSLYSPSLFFLPRS